MIEWGQVGNLKTHLALNSSAKDNIQCMRNASKKHCYRHWYLNIVVLSVLDTIVSIVKYSLDTFGCF